MEQEKEEGVKEIEQLLGTISKTVLIVLYMLLLNGFVIYKFWYWYITLPFNSIAIDFKQAIGISLLVNIIKSHSFASIKYFYTNSLGKEQEVRQDKGVSVYAGYIAPWLILLIGLIIHKIIY